MSKIIIVEPNSNDKDQVRAYLVKGERGYSAYDIYVQNGGTLTEEEWIDAFLNADNFYNKSETDNLLDDKADTSTTLAGYGITDAYTKNETYSKTEIGDLSELETTDKTSIVNAINENNAEISNINGQLLWTNPNPTSAFEAQTITLDESLSNYNMYEIIFKTGSIASDPLADSGKLPIASGFFSSIIGDNIYYRSWTVSNNTITMSDASRIINYGSAPTTNNYGMLPMYIIGYKTGPFS